MKSVLRTPSPGPLDSTTTQMTTHAMYLEPLSTSSGSNISTLEPYEVINNAEKSRNANSSCQAKGTGSSVYIEPIPLEQNYESIAMEFGKFGHILEIRVNLMSQKQTWEAWITYSNQEDAIKVCNEIKSNAENAKCSLIEKPPGNLDIYRPNEWKEASSTTLGRLERSPKPPEWLIATSHGENCNIIKMSKYLQRQVGGINKSDISRFGRNSLLIHAKSATQSVMLQNMKIETKSMLKKIKPHFNFSYAKGVIFDDNVYDFTEQEILEMSPDCVWKVFKVPNSRMVILTFEDTNVPTYIYYENIRTEVRPFKPRPLQCFNCFSYGHPSRICQREKICSNCSKSFHGECEQPKFCLNCKGQHRPNEKNCVTNKREQEALLKSEAEHISIGFAKKLLAKSRKYSEVVSSSVSPKKATANNKQPKFPKSSSQRIAHHTSMPDLADGNSVSLNSATSQLCEQKS